MIAESIIAAAQALGPSKVPMVVRLQGTNAKEGLELVSAPYFILCILSCIKQLRNSSLNLHIEADFGEAARRVIQLANAT